MHRTPCIEKPRDCRLGQPGHCASCPHRGQHDPRWERVARLRSYAGAVVEDGFPVDEVPAKVAAELWPESEREWVERDDRWAERANYWQSIHTQELIRTLLRELFDADRIQDEVQEVAEWAATAAEAAFPFIPQGVAYQSCARRLFSLLEGNNGR